MDYRESALWRNSLGCANYSGSREAWRSRLSASYEAIRRQAIPLAGEIARDLGSFTVHDISHLDALWEVASMIAGDDITINPIEAYIFGGAIVCHDLAMSVAAYPNGINDVDSHPLFLQAAALLFRNSDASGLRLDEMSEARAWVLRENHANRAARLPLDTWTNQITGTSHQLIEDTELRETFGYRIGRFAQSHHWPVSRVITELSQRVGPPGGAPPEWTVDEFKIAALLRTADAAHIDQRRAPSFLFTLRHLSGIPASHWLFQSLLQLPVLQGNRLCYNSTRAFTAAEADAWWLCYDTICMIHRELSAIDAFLEEYHPADRFAARGVVGANDPYELSRRIPVKDWLAVDARPSIQDIADLIARLGGTALYGSKSLVPLRELLQNAIDAVRAIAVEKPEAASVAAIECALRRLDSGAYVLRVSDSGIGMSESVMLNSLLRFGGSLWKSELLRREFPYLAATRFHSIGKFGLGFFSVFMWSKTVTVTTRRYDARPDETLVLEFRHGLDSRPILREASESERRFSGGTSVELEIPNLDVFSSSDRPKLLEDAIAAIVPYPVSPISVDDRGKKGEIPAIDWTVLAEETFGSDWAEAFVSRGGKREDIARFIRPVVEEDGRIVGRAALIVAEGWSHNASAEVIDEGGTRLGDVWQMVGVLLGEATNAARDQFRLLASPAAVRAWISEQARLLASAGVDAEEQVRLADYVASVGGDVGELCVALTSEGALTLRELRRWSRGRSFVIVASGWYDENATDPFDLRDGVAYIDYGVYALARALLGDGSAETERKIGDMPGLQRVIAQAVLQEWDLSIGAQEEALAGEGADDDLVIGTHVYSKRDELVSSRHVYVLFRTAGASLPDEYLA